MQQTQNKQTAESVTVMNSHIRNLNERANCLMDQLIRAEQFAHRMGPFTVEEKLANKNELPSPDNVHFKLVELELRMDFIIERFAKVNQFLEETA
jgi:hypothetical protein